MDKNLQMVEFLQTCPIISENSLFFNFGNVENDAHQLTIRSDDISLDKTFIDGSQLKRYTCVIDSFKSVACIPILPGNTDENIEDLADVQALIDWINTQDDNFTYPDFGDKIVVDSMKTLTSKPDLVGVESQLNPPVAIYRITIQIDYLDYTKSVWN